MSLHALPDEFDRIEIGGVGRKEYPGNIQFPCLLPRLLRPVGPEIVEDHHDIFFRVGRPYLLQEVAYALLLRVLLERNLTLASQGIKTKGVGSHGGGILLDDWLRERPEPLGIGHGLGRSFI